MSEASTSSTSGVNETALQWPITKSSYQFGNSIGQGATSVVYEAKCLTNNLKCAIKIINLEKYSTSASLDEINREIKSMKNMKSRNIVAYHASFVAKTELCIVMDLCQRGSLLDIIKHIQSQRDTSCGVFDENTIATILRDVLRGMAYIHENGLVHRDLKCANLLITDDLVIQIADFGVAGFLATQPLTATGSVDLRRYTFVGTPCWMAPEVMQQMRGYNQKADIWSLGITTLEMATGHAPYSKYAPMKVLMLTLKNDPPDIDTMATGTKQYENYHSKFRKFIRCCLLKDPAQRLSARELLVHSYIKSKAKDRDILYRVFPGGETHLPTTHSDNHILNTSEKSDAKNNSTEWNFDTIGHICTSEADSDESDDETDHSNKQYGSDAGIELTHTRAGNAFPMGSLSGAVPIGAPTTIPVDILADSYKAGSGSIPPAPACTPVSPDLMASMEGMNAVFASALGISNQNQPELKEPSDETTEQCYRITLRKRNPKLNYELQDISFDYVIGKDSAEAFARELVEHNLLDGCDIVLVAHNISELISNPRARERVFPLNSPPSPGQVPSEAELQGYAKMLIRIVGSSTPKIAVTK